MEYLRKDDVGELKGSLSLVGVVRFLQTAECDDVEVRDERETEESGESVR